jgi:hypothetical protein
MIRKKTGFKELTILVLASAALVSVACGDDDDNTPPGAAGSAGTSAGSAGKSGGGSAGTGAGGSTNGGSTNGGSTNGGSTNGGSAGTSAGGTGDTDSEGGEAGAGGVPPEDGSGGQGGEPVVGGAGGAGGEGGAPVVELATLKNLSFEEPIPGTNYAPSTGTTLFPAWTNTATPSGASFIQWKSDPPQADQVKSGNVRLSLWNAAAYVATLEQTVSPIANGTYAFSIWVARDDLADLNESYLYAVGHDASSPTTKLKKDTEAAVGAPFVKVTLSPIEVTSQSVTVGVYTDAKAGSWLNLDDASFERLPE